MLSALVNLNDRVGRRKHYATVQLNISIFSTFRYTELEGVYGKLDPLVNVDMTAEDTVQVLVVFKGRSFSTSTPGSFH